MPHSFQEHPDCGFCQVVKPLLINSLENSSKAEVRARLKFFLELFKIKVQLNLPKLNFALISTDRSYISISAVKALSI
jgi:hypothetical protein